MKTLKFLNERYGRYLAIQGWSFCLLSWGINAIKKPSWTAFTVIAVSFLMVLLYLWVCITHRKQKNAEILKSDKYRHFTAQDLANIKENAKHWHKIDAELAAMTEADIAACRKFNEERLKQG